MLKCRDINDRQATVQRLLLEVNEFLVSDYVQYFRMLLL